MTAEHGPEHDIDAELNTRERWDTRYREKSSLWSGKPNPTLVSETVSLTPGTALEAGAGEGADAIWLAKRGWTVTGVDISAVALERAAAHAAEAGVAERVTWECRDLSDWEPPARAYDLVTAHFMHMSPSRRRTFYSRLAAAVAADGTLLVVAHHPSDLETAVQRPPYPELLFTAEDLAADLGIEATGTGEWEIVTSAAAPRAATDPDGNQVTVHDTVFRVHRR